MSRSISILIFISMLALGIMLTIGGPLHAQQGQGQSVFDRADFSAGEMTYYEAEKKTVLSGGATLSGNDMVLKASTITVFIVEGNVQRLLANGSVNFSSQDTKTTAAALDYDRKANVAVFSGGVTTTRGADTVKAEKLSLDIDGGVYKMTGGPVRGVLGGSQ